MSPKQKIVERGGIGTCSLTRSTRGGRGGGEGACWSFEIRTKKSDKHYLLIQTYIKPTNKSISSLSRAPLALGQATGNSGLTRLTTAQTRGKPPPSPIQYALRLSTTPASKWLLSRDSQGGVPKLSQFGLLPLCELIILCLDL